MRLQRLMCGVVFFVLIGCSTSPTGRTQFNLFGDSLNQQGIAAFTALREKVPESTDPIKNQLVQCIVDSIIPIVDENFGKQAWEVVVFDDEQVNAFAVPGGKIGVYTGILEVAETPDQLAAIIGHEIGHVLAQHGSERASIQLGTQALLVGSKVAMDANEVSRDKQNAYLGILGLGAIVGVNLPYSRLHESEADLIGLDLMVQAGYDPQGAVELWQNMQALKGANKRPPELLSTHPSAATRVRDLERAIPLVVAKHEDNIRSNECI